MEMCCDDWSLRLSESETESHQGDGDPDGAGDGHSHTDKLMSGDDESFIESFDDWRTDVSYCVSKSSPQPRSSAEQDHQCISGKIENCDH